MVYIHFPSNLTDEEVLLQQKYAKLKKKKKALQNFQSPKPEQEKITLKRALEPKDAKEYAKKLILSGKISVPAKNSAQKSLFKKPLGLERKLSDARTGGFSPAPGETNYSSSGGMTPYPGSASPSPSIHFEPFTPSVPDPSGPSSLFAQPGPSGTSRNFGGGSNSRFGGSSSRGRKSTTAAIPPYNFKESSTGTAKEFSTTIKKEFGVGHKQGHTTVHVRGKGNGFNEALCRDVFAKFGAILNVTMELERSCAFVTFNKTDAAESAIQEVNGSLHREVLLEVSYARRQPQVTELINDAPASATWTQLATSQSQKGTYQDKRATVVYDDI